MAYIWQINGTPNSGVNLTPATGSVMCFNLISALLQAGWVKFADSDGTTYSSTGAQVTSGTGSPGGLANTSAWIAMRMPVDGGGHEITFQRGTTDLVWRIKWLHGGGFPTTGPDGGTATRTPYHAGERILVGGGTDASPTYATAIAGNGTYKQHIVVQDVAPYAWINMIYTSTGRGWRFIPMLAGSYPSADVAPYVIAISNASWQVAVLGGTASNSTIGDGWYKKGLSGEAWVTFSATNHYTGSSAAIPGSIPVSPYDSKDGLYSMGALRRNAQSESGWKGKIDPGLLCWTGPSRNAGDRIITAGGTYAVINDIAMIWPTGVTVST
jgi:hypothetical protein